MTIRLNISLHKLIYLVLLAVGFISFIFGESNLNIARAQEMQTTPDPRATIGPRINRGYGNPDGSIQPKQTLSPQSGSEIQSFGNGVTTRVSINTDRTQGNGESGAPSLSADGRFVAFESFASNLVSGDINGKNDIFVHDRQTGVTTRVSVNSNGEQADDHSGYPSISADGRYVAFDSSALNLATGNSRFIFQIYIHDRQTGITTCISTSPNGIIGNSDSYRPSISADGRYIAYYSGASNLVSGDDHGYDVFVYDRILKTTTLVSKSTNGVKANGYSEFPSISGDGHHIIFESDANNLVAGDTNNMSDIFVHDLETDVTERVSVDSNGNEGNENSWGFSSISFDGRYTVFTSYASNLVAEDTNPYTDTFVHDNITGITERVSVNNNGSSDGGSDDMPSISDNGRFVAFNSFDSNLVEGDTNGEMDVFVHDRLMKVTTMVSESSNGVEGNGQSYYSSISSDGRYVAFHSGASNLVVGDTNGKNDIFVHDRGSETTHNLSISHIEITQAIQDEGNTVPLISGKTTYVRVYVDCGEGCSSIPGVTGELTASRQGIPEKQTLLPKPFSISSYHESWIDQRGFIRKTLNFTLPLEWSSGTITLSIEVGNEQWFMTVTFVDAKSISIAFVPIRDNGNEIGSLDLKSAQTSMKKVYPVSEIKFKQLPTWEWKRPLYCSFLIITSEVNKCLRQNLINQLNNLYQTENGDFIYGLLPATTNLGVGGFSDPIWYGGNGKAAFSVYGSEIYWSNEVIIHETAHLLGRRHTNTGECGDTDIETDWPYATAKIQEWGLDGFSYGWLIGYDDPGTNTSLKNPATTYDYMAAASCGNPYWTSPFTYYRIFLDSLQKTALSYNSNFQSDVSSFSVITGTVFTNDNVQIEPVWIVDSNTPQNPPIGTNYCIDSQNSIGNTLSQYCFNLNFLDYETGESSSVDGFTLMLPYSAEVARIVLKKGSQELAVQTVSPNSPQVTITYPNGGETWSATGSQTITWDASDLDGDPLTFKVFYSPDGTNWLPIGSNINDTQLTIDASELPGSSTASVRVMVSDGGNTSSDESDASFTVASKGPQVTILSPDGNVNIGSGSSLLFNGSAYDLEDGSLGDSTLTWSSSLDGFLGTGSSILATLSPGLHTITLTAVDSNLNSAFFTVQIGVDTCYPLTVTHAWQGSDPITNPLYSSICPDGYYLEGELINLSSATPESGWYIRSWTGTDEDTSMLATNTLTMPASAHHVSVNYAENPTISGNTGVGGVSLAYTDGTPKSATADGAGDYSFSVPYNWSGTVTPSLEGYSFSPASKEYTNVQVDQTGQNFTAALNIPANLQASDGTYTDKVLLNWDPVSAATSCNVYRATSSAGAKTLLGNPTENTFDDTTATPGVTYYYFVTACIGTDCSDFSTEDTGWRKLSAPANLQASDGSFTGKVQLTWTASIGATYYEVYRAMSWSGTKTLIGTPMTTNYYDSTATPGITYYYWVKACLGARCSAFPTPNTGWRKLSAPLNLLASDGTYTTKVQLTWTASSGATSYIVSRADSWNGLKTQLGSPTAATFADTTATPGVTYYYWVKACRGTRCSVNSAYNAGWRALTAPANLQASDGTYTTKVQLTWTASSGATFYKVYRATSAGGTKTLLSSPTSASYADLSATPGVTYYYWVKACRSTRCSLFSISNTGWRKK